MATATLRTLLWHHILPEDVFETIAKAHPPDSEYEGRASLSLLIFQFQKLFNDGIDDFYGHHTSDNRVGSSCLSLIFVPHDVSTFIDLLGTFLLYRCVLQTIYCHSQTE